MFLSSLLPILAILAAAVVLVVLLWRLMHRHVPSATTRSPEVHGAIATGEAATDTGGEYLDSSHIIHPPPRAPVEPPR